jgi:hypothetical protein
LRVTFHEIVSPLLASQPLLNRAFGGSWPFLAFNQVKHIIEIIVPIALFIVFFWTMKVLVRRYEARRTRQIQAALSSLGFTLQEERSELYLRYVGLFKIGQRGHSRQISNRFESALHADGITQLMDYSFEEGSGKGRRAFRHTLAVISDKRMELPAFVLAPQKFFSRIAQRFGAHDIDFEGFPRFNGTFKLLGDDEPAVRSVFTSAVIEELERHPDITLEGQTGKLLMFRAGKRVKPENFPRFHEEAQQIAQLFLP